jgi:hypothetical protein
VTKDAANTVADTAKDVVNTVADTATDAANTVADTTTDAANTAADWTKDTANTVADTTTDAANEAVNWTKDAANTVADTAADVGLGVADYVSKPFKEMADGDIWGGLKDAWKTLTPAGVTYDLLDNISVRHVNIANASGAPIAVIVAANKDWTAVDLSTAVVLALISFGSSAPSGLEAMKNAKTLWDVYQATRYYRSIASLAGEVYKDFAEKGTSIENGECREVSRRSNSNPLNYLDPSQYAALANASDLTMMIVRKDGRAALVNTNSDVSWIVYPEFYCRAKSGKLWEPADNAPIHLWDQ